MSEERKIALSIARTGSGNPMYGRKQTDKYYEGRSKMIGHPNYNIDGKGCDWSKGLTKETDERVKHNSESKKDIPNPKHGEILKNNGSLKGEKNPAWVDGNFMRLHFWTKTIKERDNHICQKCGSDITPSAHHIYPKEEYPELKFILSNGITYCRHCHLSYEQTYRESLDDPIENHLHFMEN